jgi:hypothetical protein
MINIAMVREWHICTPTAFRFMDQQYVDEFFAEGKLRLSSFARFASHADEERLDVSEGQVTFSHRTKQGGGQTLLAQAAVGRNAFVLCAAMRRSDEIQTAFGCNSYISINNTEQFAMAIANKLPGFVTGWEGPCLYQSTKIIDRDLGFLELPRTTEEIQRIVFEGMKQYPYFLKHERYANQVEYRFVWQIAGEIPDYLDISIPEAIQWCTRPGHFD